VSKILIHSIAFSPDGVSTAYLYNDIEPLYLTILHWGVFLMALPVLLYSAVPFYQGFWRDIKGSKMTVITARTELLAYYERRGYVQSNELQAFPRDINAGEPKQELQLVTLYKPFRA